MEDAELQMLAFYLPTNTNQAFKVKKPCFNTAINTFYSYSEGHPSRVTLFTFSPPLDE